ncbi:ATP-binding protein [Microbacterium sp. NPDC055665]
MNTVTSTPSTEQDLFAPDPLAPLWSWEPDRGYQITVNRWQKSAGFLRAAVPGAISTTRQTEILNPAIIRSSAINEGVIDGIDTMTGEMVHHDPVTAYRAFRRRVDSPNVCIFGDVGTGKSSLLKTVYLLRQLLLLGRRAVVISKKMQGDDADEYAPAAKLLGVKPVRLTLDGTGSRLNILDPAVTGTKGPYAILVDTLTLMSGKRPDKWERQVLRRALAAVYKSAGEATPVLDDLIAELYRHRAPGVAPQLIGDRVLTAAWGLAAELEELTEAYGGIFSGETSAEVTLGKKLTVFDISDLPEEGPVLSVVMSVINTWVLEQLKTRRAAGYRDVLFLIVEEGWYLVRGPMGARLRSNARLSRALGLVLVVAIHHPSDIPADDPAIAFIQDAGTVYVYRQARPADALAAVELAGMHPDAVEYVQRLPKGEHYLKVGLEPERRVRHLRSAIETSIADTDGGLGGHPAQEAA